MVLKPILLRSECNKLITVSPNSSERRSETLALIDKGFEVFLDAEEIYHTGHVGTLDAQPARDPGEMIPQLEPSL
jgi:hypothetical protein